MRTKMSFALAVAVALTLAPMVSSADAAEAYALDNSHSNIGFAVKHFGISNVRGQFTQYTGELMIDEEDLANSSVKLEIAAASIDTNHEQRDGHLKSADFFDVEAHPALTFASTGIEKTGEGEFLVTGDLTMRGTTREIQMPVVVGGPIDARGSLRRSIAGRL